MPRARNILGTSFKYQYLSLYLHVTNSNRIQIHLWKIAYPNTRMRYSAENVYPTDPFYLPSISCCAFAGSL